MSASDFTRGPTRTDVRRDLVRLRVRRGISYGRTDDAKVLPWLDVVEHELESRGRPAEDRGSVTYDVIDCVGRSRQLLGPQSEAIVRITLNLDQQEPWTLGGRRVQAMREIGEVDTDRFERYEDDAYNQLAGVLLRLDASPCGPTEPHPTDVEAKVAGQLEVFIRAVARSHLAAMLTFLHDTTNEDEAERISRKIFEELVRGKAHADAISSGAFLDRLLSLCAGAVGIYLVAWNRVDTTNFYQNDLFPRLAEADCWSGRVAAYVVPNLLAGISAAQESLSPDLRDGPDRTQPHDWHVFIQQLTHILLVLEATGDWGSLSGSQNEARWRDPSPDWTDVDTILLDERTRKETDE